MIEAHSTNSFLAPYYRTPDGWFSTVSYINGMVAPIFLFLAGLLQGAWIRKNWDLKKPIVPKLRSLGIILLLGYALQFPWDALVHWQAGSAAAILVALGKVDILHCIAVTLASCLLLSRLCKSRVTYDVVITGIATAIVLLAPFVWNRTENLTTTNPLLGYISSSNGALFPLIPWSAFLLAGTLASRWLDQPVVFLTLSIVTCVTGWILRFALVNWFQLQTYATRYDFYFFRLSIVFLCCGVIAFYFGRNQAGSVARAVNWCGSHSLGLYVWHLVILHSGLGFVAPLMDYFSRTQTPVTVVWLYLLTLIGAMVLTKIWNALKARIFAPGVNRI